MHAMKRLVMNLAVCDHGLDGKVMWNIYIYTINDHACTCITQVRMDSSVDHRILPADSATCSTIRWMRSLSCTHETPNEGDVTVEDQFQVTSETILLSSSLLMTP